MATTYFCFKNVLTVKKYFCLPMCVASKCRCINILAVVIRNEIFRNAVVEKPIGNRTSKLQHWSKFLNISVDRQFSNRRVGRKRDGVAIDVSVDAFRNGNRFAGAVTLKALTSFTVGWIVDFPHSKKNLIVKCPLYCRMA